MIHQKGHFADKKTGGIIKRDSYRQFYKIHLVIPNEIDIFKKGNNEVKRAKRVFGNPAHTISDRETAFSLTEFKEYC